MSTKLASPDTATHFDVHHQVSTAWVPRTVRCHRCGEIAREEIRERLSDDEIAVHYGCAECRTQQTRHYHESELEIHSA